MSVDTQASRIEALISIIRFVLKAVDEGYTLHAVKYCSEHGEHMLDEREYVGPKPTT